MYAAGKVLVQILIAVLVSFHVESFLLLQVSHYKRLVPLVVEERGLDGSYQAVKPGDCIIVFSRKQVFEIRRKIESSTGLKCAVVYGSLPPGMWTFLREL